MDNFVGRPAVKSKTQIWTKPLDLFLFNRLVHIWVFDFTVERLHKNKSLNNFVQ